MREGAPVPSSPTEPYSCRCRYVNRVGWCVLKPGFPGLARTHDVYSGVSGLRGQVDEDDGGQVGDGDLGRGQKSRFDMHDKLPRSPRMIRGASLGFVRAQGPRRRGTPATAVAANRVDPHRTAVQMTRSARAHTPGLTPVLALGRSSGSPSSGVPPPSHAWAQWHVAVPSGLQ